VIQPPHIVTLEQYSHHSLLQLQCKQGPDMGKCRSRASRKVPPPHQHYRHQVVVKPMKDYLLFLLFTKRGAPQKSAAPGHCPPPPLVGGLSASIQNQHHSQPGVHQLRPSFKNLCGPAHVIRNINYSGRALIKTLCPLHEDI